MSSDDVARRAALRLGDELDRQLPAMVEAQLQGGGEPPERYEPATAIALAALILSAAKFAWDIYRDLMKDSKTLPTAEVIARRTRLELNKIQEVESSHLDRVITVVVDEVMRQPPAA